MSLGLGLTLIGLALFIGASAGMLVMGMFCSTIRAERDAFKQETIRLNEQEKALRNELSRVGKLYEELIERG